MDSFLLLKAIPLSAELLALERQEGNGWPSPAPAQGLNEA